MFLSKKFNVYVKNLDRNLEAKAGTDLFKLLKDNGIDIYNLCEGNGQCGKCKVKVEGKNLAKPSKTERKILSEMTLSAGVRLACEYHVKSDLIIDTEEPRKREDTDPNILGVEVRKRQAPVEADEQDENEFKSVLSTEMFMNKAEEKEDEEDFISNYTPSGKNSTEPLQDIEPLKDIETEPEKGITSAPPHASDGKGEKEAESDIEPIKDIETEPEKGITSAPPHASDGRSDDAESDIEPIKDIETEPEKGITSAPPHASDGKGGGDTEEPLIRREPEEEPETYATDGLIMIQAPGGVKYYHYSAGIGTISMDGMAESDLPLADMLSDGTIGDFIDKKTETSRPERVIVILSEERFDGIELFNLITYHTAEQLGTLYEVIQPLNSPMDILAFFRFLNQASGRKLIIPLDMLERVYHYHDGKISELSTEGSYEDITFDKAPLRGKNPVVKVDSNLVDYTYRHPEREPDSLSLASYFRIAALLYEKGLTDSKLNLINRAEVEEQLAGDPNSMTITTKFTKTPGEDSFRIFSKSSSDLFITGSSLRNLHRLRKFIMAAVLYTEKLYGRPDSIVFYTMSQCEGLAENIVKLEMVPEKYGDLIKTFSGDPTMFAVNFFQAPTVKAYLDNKLRMEESFNLFDTDEFRRIYDRMEQEFEG
ncbi:2Fe-2S iron-sulfur cluster-binding protein [Limisalsivibrio acetivorans]|uniref:2Fe-2S iron-sulfur cluster-binding protein n=1 Tax=Limisalsivibrio acetivorans TaxID=1304888 RepID=UPI0003B5E48D|nr:2Fe-2S iron-sulfur cluster-binding protein [Limisalsivibrio acetivorans]